jgi:hypothetical protein
MIYSGEQFINIFPTTEEDYKDVIVYFENKKPAFRMRYAKIFWNDYGHYGELISDKELS